MRYPSTLVASILALTASAAAQRWKEMDYGPVISSTIEGFSSANVGYKARAIDLGDGAWVVFDTETLRVVAAVTDGELQLRGTPFDGSHGPIPRALGTRVFRTGPGPGWAKRGSFEDPRSSEYGPLPRDWARHVGHYLHGDDVVLRYTVGGSTDVLERFSRVEHDGCVGIARTWSITGLPAAGAAICVSDGALDARSLDDRVVATYEILPRPGRVRIDTTADWASMGIGAPSKDDAATGCDVTWIEGHGERREDGGDMPVLVDGDVAQNEDDPDRCVFTDSNRARFAIDLGEAIPVQRISTYSWHRDRRAKQMFRVYGAAEDLPRDADDLLGAGWEEIAFVDTDTLGDGGKHGSSIAAEDGAPLGTFRHLLFEAYRSTGGTLFTEIDVYTPDQAVELRERHSVSYLALVTPDDGAKLTIEGDRIVAHVQGGAAARRVQLIGFGGIGERTVADVRALADGARDDTELAPLTEGGPGRWPQEVTTQGRRGDDKRAYAVDTITVPADNPWKSWLRFGAFDFLSPTSAVLSTWSGDVWRVDGIDDDLDELRWRRIATGLHDPLGLKVVDGVIHTHGRDGISRLHDLNGDGEIDFYETFNNDVLVTRNFHEFAFDLQLDAEGNFYFSKGGPVKPGGRGFDEILPHHGTIMRVSKDGSKLDVVATGLRAPNGISISKDGVLTSGDNEGTWMPKCRLNWFPREGMFASCVDTSHMDPKPDAYGDPICWFPMDVDNSGGGQCWVTGDRWGPLEGRLLHESYGTCSLFLVLVQHDGDRVQGGVARFPIDFDSSVMRGRFHESGDGQLYVCGFKGWQTRAAKDTAFHRVRYTGKPLRMPTGLTIGAGTIDVTFSERLDEELATDPESFTVEAWDYVWSSDYGSIEVKPSDPDKKVKHGEKNRDTLDVVAAELSEDGMTVRLRVEGLTPVMQMRIEYDLEDEAGEMVFGEIFNTVNWVPESAR